MRSESERLEDILQAIIQIRQYADVEKHIFDQNKLIQDGIFYQLLIIGEAVRALSSDFREQHGNIPWSSIIGMRNILIHEYFVIDTETVWAVIVQDLPKFEKDIEQMLNIQGLYQP